MGDEAHNRRGFLVLGAHLGDHRQRLDAVAVQVHDNQRRLFFRALSLFRDFLVGLYELHLNVQLARNFLDLGDKEKIVDEGETIVWREVDRVRVRSFLPLGICAVPRVLHEGRGFAQFSVWHHWEGCDAAACVVRDQHVLSTFVDGDVARIGAARGNLIQEGQLASRAIDGERAHATAVRPFVVLNFIDGVEIFPVGMQGYE